jgi:TATA-box binding protein (TBP) (component of TFIID and TFIIIB)
MLHQATPLINNYKISVRVKSRIILNVKKVAGHDKYHGNYAVIRLTYVYIVYYSGWVNVTGIRNRLLFPAVISNLLDFTNLNYRDLVAVTVDNISAAGTFGKPLSIRFIRKSLELIKCEKIFDYKPGKFCGASIKFGKRKGTINLFTSGNYTIVGANTDERVNEIFFMTKTALFGDVQPFGI